MKYEKHEAVEAAEFIGKFTATSPEIGLLTGTGLGESAENLEDLKVLAYTAIPHFPVPTVQSHAGRLLIGRMAGRSVVALQGRFHLYEGYSPAAVTFPIRVMQELGVKTLILTNAAGGLNKNFSAGDIMLIEDHINLTGANPLIGPNEDTWGVRFPDMTSVYDRHLATIARQAGANADIPLQKGVYAGLKGPSLETPAEIRFLKTIGCDAVGFSTVQEVIAAVHAGMNILGLSTITNINDPDAPAPATLEEIIAVANSAAPKLEKIIEKVVAAVNQ